MATTTPTASQTTKPNGERSVAFHGIGWEGYRTLLQVRGESRQPRMIYLDGDLLLMSPSHIHEFAKERLSWFVHVVLVECAIDCHPAGQTTFRDQARQGGIEGDLTYYLANEPRVRGSGGRALDLRHDPPPDLAIEVVYTHAADAAIEVYRRLGVPELWIWEDERLRIVHLQADETYVESPTSLAFPFLSAVELTDWINRPEDISETRWAIALHRWVRDVLVPRARGQAPEPPHP